MSRHFWRACDREAGFSFVELLVTIIIAGIAFAAMVPVFVGAQQAASGEQHAQRGAAAGPGQAREDPRARLRPDRSGRTSTDNSIPERPVRHHRLLGDRRRRHARLHRHVPGRLLDSDGSRRHRQADRSTSRSRSRRPGRATPSRSSRSGSAPWSPSSTPARRSRASTSARTTSCAEDDRQHDHRHRAPWSSTPTSRPRTSLSMNQGAAEDEPRLRAVHHHSAGRHRRRLAEGHRPGELRWRGHGPLPFSVGQLSSRRAASTSSRPSPWPASAHAPRACRGASPSTTTTSAPPPPTSLAAPRSADRGRPSRLDHAVHRLRRPLRGLPLRPTASPSPRLATRRPAPPTRTSPSPTAPPTTTRSRPSTRGSSPGCCHDAGLGDAEPRRRLCRSQRAHAAHRDRGRRRSPRCI